MRRFFRDEGGLALTEYLVLLALLTGGVLASASLYGGALGDKIAGWGDFLSAVLPDPSGDGEEAQTPNTDTSGPVTGTDGAGQPGNSTGTQTASDDHGRNCASEQGRSSSRGRSDVSCQ